MAQTSSRARLPATAMTRFFETIHGIFFDDLDPFAILHNARYVLLFERALGAFWMHVGWGGFQDASRPEQFHPSEQQGGLPGSRGAGQVRVFVGLGSSSMKVRFAMLPMDRDTLHAEGAHDHPRRSRTLRPKPWTDPFRAVMTPWLPGQADEADEAEALGPGASRSTRRHSGDSHGDAVEDRVAEASSTAASSVRSLALAPGNDEATDSRVPSRPACP